MIVAVPLVAFGISAHQETGIVNDCDVPTFVYVALFEPKVIFTVCVKDELYLVMLTVPDVLPSAGTIDGTEKVDTFAAHVGYNVIAEFAVYVAPRLYDFEPPSDIAHPDCSYPVRVKIAPRNAIATL